MIAAWTLWRRRWSDDVEREALSRTLMLPFAIIAVAAAIGWIASESAIGVVVALVAVAGAAALLAFPDVSVPFVLFLIWSDAAAVSVEHGLPSIVGMGLPALLLVPIAHRIVFLREKLVFDRALVWMLGYLAVMLLGAARASRIETAFDNIVVFLTEGLLLFFLITNAVRTPRVLRATTWAIVLAGLFLGVLSSVQQATGTFDNDYWGFAKVTNATFGTGEEDLSGEVRQVRLGGPLGDQNRYAQNQLLVAFLAVFVAWSERRLLLRLVAFAAAAFAAAGSALTFSRGAAVAFVMSLLAMVVLRYVRVKHMLVIVLGAGLVLAAVPQFGQRLGSLAMLASAGDSDTAGLQAADGATRGRLNEMISAAMAFRDHPFIGLGPGMFRFHFLDYAEDAGFKAQVKPREAHNLVLGIAADHGGLGLVTFGGVLVVALAGLHRERRRWLTRRPTLALLIAGHLMMLITYLTTGVFLHMAYERFFWSTIAMACAAAAIARHEAELEAQAASARSG